MMNKSKIEWCDFTWNPVTGCRHKCEYCYARRQAQRFCGDIRLNKTSDQLQNAGNGLWILEEPFKNNQGKVIPLPVGFEPTLHRYRLPMPAQKKKPANIFVCSMADLFGDWTPGRYAWELANIKLLPKPIRAKGAQRIWNWDETDPDDQPLFT